MHKCRQCDYRVAADSAKCPNCGEKNPALRWAYPIAAIALLILLIILLGF